MKFSLLRKRLAFLLLGAASLWASQFSSFANSTKGAKYCGIPLPVSAKTTLDRYGVPFLEGWLPLDEGGSAQVNVGGRAQRIFLLGMTDANKPSGKSGSSFHFGSGPGSLPCYGWADARDGSRRCMIGDELGQIQLNYADGTSQIFPLILGESVWWGPAFDEFQEPFPSNVQLRKAFANDLRLYPPLPVKDGNYVAVINTRNVPLRSITFSNSPAKKGTLIVTGITIESVDTNTIAGATILTPGDLSPEFATFMAEKPLCARGEDENQTRGQLNDLELALYSSEETFKGPVMPQLPAGYSGPLVSFKGSIYGNVLANAFSYNVQDIQTKIDEQGMYHTSTKGAISWGSYRGFGTFRTNIGAYYHVSYTRDMGRSLQEISVLDYTNEAGRCADYNLRMARLYQTRPSLKYKGVTLPPHWGDLVNQPRNPSFENDGQGLTILFLYKLWQRLPDRDDWLHSRWPDVKAAGDWILWQLANPEISGATNGVLYTTGESGNGGGYAVYPDSVCMNALRALACMADSIGETNSAEQWRTRADEMQVAIGKEYIVQDAKYGPVWTLANANWADNSSVLGPLIFLADYQGFAPEDEHDDWRAVDEAAYQRLIDTYRPYQPFGFYGKAMGYGQGFVTQSALLLDRMHDATTMLDWAAKEIYDQRINQFDHFIVPEGVQISPDGRFWFRFGDLGNGVQEGEIIKTLRLVMGVDDTHPNRLQFYPRMPYDWSEIAVEKYPVLFANSGKMEMASLHYKLERTRKGMKLEISADKALGLIAMRLGPFDKQPEISKINMNGQIPSGALIEHSGDSWWVKFNTSMGPNTTK